MNHKTCFSMTVLFFFVIVCVFAQVTKAQNTQRTAMEGVDPEPQFEKTHELFLKKDLKAAASEIRKAVAFLKQEAGRATKDGKKGPGYIHPRIGKGCK